MHLPLRLKLSLCILIHASLIGCAVDSPQDLGYTPEPGLETHQHEEYLKGKTAAKTNLKNGHLVFEDVNNGEEERWQVIWCYRKLLMERYGIEYRCFSFTPGSIAYAAGYQSVIRPIIDARLGSDWEARILREAEIFHRKHWSEVADLYRVEQWSGS